MDSWKQLQVCRVTSTRLADEITERRVEKRPEAFDGLESYGDDGDDVCA